ncbi:MAG TPA: DPP IV N-terminal domain-containing protein [Xanthobacteraceae bacterium]
MNLDFVFKWIPTTDRFWFRRQSSGGDEYFVVDAATGRQSPAFDPARMKAALGAAHAGTANPSGFTIVDLDIKPDGSGMRVKTPSGSFDCDAKATRCIERPAPLGADFVVSPDGTRAIHRRGNDLWLRDLASGAEKQLTTDGEENFGYGDIDGWRDLRLVARRRNAEPTPLLGVRWSPDGRYVIALRQDLRPFPERALVTEFVPPDGGFSITHFRRIGTPGDPKRPDSRLVIIDMKAGLTHAVALDPQALNDFSLEYLLTGLMWWTKDGHTVFLFTANRGGKRVGLCALDLDSGRTRQVLEEEARFNVRLNPADYARPNVYVFANGREALWYSERSGNGHLYLYDATNGRLKRAITTGDWPVFDLLRVDEARRIAYFTAKARGGDENPYHSYLYRVSLDGGQPKLLTPEVANHEFANFFGAFGTNYSPISESRISPSGRYFIDTYSSTDQPPKTNLRTSDGKLVISLLNSDASALYATGWSAPERVVAKAADGSTDLYGVLFRPRDFDPSHRYPVIDFMYPGPQGRWCPLSFSDPMRGYFHNSQTFADAGFIVVCVDGRGTAGRSRAFRDAFLSTEDVLGAADHVAAVKSLAASRPFMDLQRVGVMGNSFGGYGSLRAMLLYPEFFKVGVSGVGPADWYHLTSEVSVERMFGAPSDSEERRRFYELASNTRLASRLQGRVLLIYAGIDENVLLINAFRLADAFIKADKDVDTLMLPDSAHPGVNDPYPVRRTIQYFKEHLEDRR